MASTLKNYIANDWVSSHATDTLDVHNPATQDSLAYVPIGKKIDVELVVKAASDAYSDWRNTPTNERIQYLFKFKHLLEEHVELVSHYLQPDIVGDR